MTRNRALPAIVRTQRLVLRQPVATDLAYIVAMADNPKMPLTTATLPYPYGEADGLAYIADASTTLDAYAIAGADDRFMGTILFNYPAGKPPEIGYWLGEPHWGQGYAGEAVAGLVAAVRDIPGFETIHARVLDTNPASVRVLEKAGFAIIERTSGVVERHLGKPMLVLCWSRA